MFWICAGNNVDNSGMFKLWLRSVYTESRPLLLTPPCPWAGDAQKVERRYSQDS